MRIRGRRRRTVVFIVLGACLVALAVAFYIAWIVLNWREGLLLAVGVLVFPLIIAGLVLNTIFLVREVRRNEQHNAFINAVTHELKTPVASIRLYLETLQTRDVDAPKRAEFQRIMLADTDRLLATIEQILRTGRSGHAHRAIDSEPLALETLARECMATIRSRYHLPPAAISLAVTPLAGSAVVSGDGEEIRAAIANLLDNAVKYSSPLPEDQDQPAVRIEIDRRDARYLTLTVTDRGPGIAAPELKAIFKRFYRAPGSARTPGTGLGLFIVRSVVRRHGGRVYAESPGLGRGSTFVIQLPCPAPAFRAIPPGATITS